MPPGLRHRLAGPADLVNVHGVLPRKLVVLGSPRSGTTWLGKIFDSHPDVLYLHEPDTIRRNWDIPFLPEGEDLQGAAAAFPA